MTDKESTVSQLAGLIGLVRRSGAMAPFLNLFILSLFPFALISVKSDIAYGQPVAFWALVGLGAEICAIFLIGTFLAIFKTDYLLTEQHQKEMKKLESGRKGLKNDSVENDLKEKDDTINCTGPLKEVVR